MTFRSFAKNLMTGLAVLLPLTILIMVIYWFMATTESLMAKFYLFVFPDKIYFPGLGLLTGIALATLTGLSMNHTKAKRLYDSWESLLKKIPFIKTIYGMVQDLVKVFSSKERKKYDKVAILYFPELKLRLLGFVTRQDFEDLNLSQSLEGEVAVYLPMSYQIGGYLVVVPKKSVEPLNMSIEDASRFIFTAGMSAEANEKQARPKQKEESVPNDLAEKKDEKEKILI